MSASYFILADDEPIMLGVDIRSKRAFEHLSWQGDKDFKVSDLDRFMHYPEVRILKEIIIDYFRGDEPKTLRFSTEDNLEFNGLFLELYDSYA